MTVCPSWTSSPVTAACTITLILSPRTPCVACSLASEVNPSEAVQVTKAPPGTSVTRSPGTSVSVSPITSKPARFKAEITCETNPAGAHDTTAACPQDGRSCHRIGVRAESSAHGARLSAAEETVTDNQKADRTGRLSIERKMVDGALVVTVRGEIDHHVKDAFSEALMSEDGTAVPSRIVADLSGVTFMDSSGINVFIAAYQQVKGAGRLRIAGAQGPVLRVLALVGVDALIPCHPTVEQALNA